MSASLTVTPSDPWDAMTPASASPRIDPSTPIQHAIIKANETNQPDLRIVFICRPPSRICRTLPIPFPVYSQKKPRPTRPDSPDRIPRILRTAARQGGRCAAPGIHDDRAAIERAGLPESGPRGGPSAGNPRNTPFLAGFPSAVAGEKDFQFGQGLLPFGAVCLPVLQTESICVLQHPYPPLPVLPQSAHGTVERRAQLRHQVAVADKERLDRLPVEAVLQRFLQPVDRPGDLVEQGNAEQARGPADEEHIGQHGKGDDRSQGLRQVVQGVEDGAISTRQRRREKLVKDEKQEKRSQPGNGQPGKKEPSPESVEAGRASPPPSRRTHGETLPIFSLSPPHLLANSSAGRTEVRKASTSPRTSSIRPRV